MGEKPGEVGETPGYVGETPGEVRGNACMSDVCLNTVACKVAYSMGTAFQPHYVHQLGLEFQCPRVCRKMRDGLWRGLTMAEGNQIKSCSLHIHGCGKPLMVSGIDRGVAREKLSRVLDFGWVALCLVIFSYNLGF